MININEYIEYIKDLDLRNIANKLKERYKICFILYALGWRQKEIADIMKISASRVSQILSEVIDNARKYIRTV